MLPTPKTLWFQTRVSLSRLVSRTTLSLLLTDCGFVPADVTVDDMHPTANSAHQRKATMPPSYTVHAMDWPTTMDDNE
jgi:hypothetical protein